MPSFTYLLSTLAISLIDIIKWDGLKCLKNILNYILIYYIDVNNLLVLFFIHD